MKKSVIELKKPLHIQSTLLGTPFQFETTWGLFSPTEIDAGTKQLLADLDLGEEKSVLDIGCGYGPLGIAIAKKLPTAHVTMVDKDFVAVEYAQKNAIKNDCANARTILSNGFSAIPEDQLFDLIVSNIPAKVGRELLWILLEDAKKHLKPGGRIVVVVIQGLKEFVKTNLKEVFGNYKKRTFGKTYVCMQATK